MDLSTLIQEKMHLCQERAKSPWYNPYPLLCPLATKKGRCIQGKKIGEKGCLFKVDPYTGEVRRRGK